MTNPTSPVGRRHSTLQLVPVSLDERIKFLTPVPDYPICAVKDCSNIHTSIYESHLHSPTRITVNLILLCQTHHVPTQVWNSDKYRVQIHYTQGDRLGIPGFHNSCIQKCQDNYPDLKIEKGTLEMDNRIFYFHV